MSNCSENDPLCHGLSHCFQAQDAIHRTVDFTKQPHHIDRDIGDRGILLSTHSSVDLGLSLHLRPCGQRRRAQAKTAK